MDVTPGVEGEGEGESEWQNVYGITPADWLITYGGGPTGGYFKRHSDSEPQKAVFVAWNQSGLSGGVSMRPLNNAALQFKEPDEDNMCYQVREVPVDLAPPHALPHLPVQQLHLPLPAGP